MMPLTLADLGKENVIRKIGGTTEVRRHLEELGFTVGSICSLVTVLNGNIIVKVKESRVALNEELASKIMV